MALSHTPAIDRAEVRRALDFDALLSAARAEAATDRFGDEDFFAPLRHLLDDAALDLSFTEAGLATIRMTLQRHLVNRLRLQRDLEVHPEILAEDVSDPLVIIGMPRTGTTKLQRIMSADPNLQSCWMWRVLNPAPFSSANEADVDPRILFARAVERSSRSNTDFMSSHETLAEGAEEDSFLLLHSLDYVMQAIITPSLRFLDYIRSRPRAPAYRFEKTLLQYLQWQDGGRRGRRWLLKNPGHVGGLDALIETFPGAIIVNSVRDMAEVIPSYCRLMEPLFTSLYTHMRPAAIGRHALDYWGPEMARLAEIRARLGARLNLVDISYRRVVGEPIVVAEELYQRAGLRLTEQGRQAMLEWDSANVQHKHGQSLYSLEQYGLTQEMVAAAFSHGTPS